MELKPDTTIHMFEYYPHYKGTRKAATTLSVAEFDSLIAAVQVTPAVEGDLDFRLDTAIEVLEARSDSKTIYSINSDILNVKKLKEIRAELEKTGTWADMWEEGSHAFSVTSLQDAKKGCALVEAGLLEEDM